MTKNQKTNDDELVGRGNKRFRKKDLGYTYLHKYRNIYIGVNLIYIYWGEFNWKVESLFNSPL